mgnify:CR=1 FL=1
MPKVFGWHGMIKSLFDLGFLVRGTGAIDDSDRLLWDINDDVADVVIVVGRLGGM